MWTHEAESTTSGHSSRLHFNFDCKIIRITHRPSPALLPRTRRSTRPSSRWPPTSIIPRRDNICNLYHQKVYLRCCSRIPALRSVTSPISSISSPVIRPRDIREQHCPSPAAQLRERRLNQALFSSSLHLLPPSHASLTRLDTPCNSPPGTEASFLHHHIQDKSSQRPAH